MERRRQRTYRRVAEPEGLTRLLRRTSESHTPVPYKRLPSLAAVSSMAWNDDLEAANAYPDLTPNSKLSCPAHRLTAAVLVQAVAILGLLATIVRTRAACGTAAVAAEVPDRCVFELACAKKTTEFVFTVARRYHT